MYDDIQVPLTDGVISASQFGVRVRDSIIDLNNRVSKIESTLSNYAFKPTSTTRASLATTAADPDLFLPLQANSKYFVEVFLSVAGLAAADIKTVWTPPSGSVAGTRRCLGPATNSTTNVNADDTLMKCGTHAFSTVVGYNLLRNANNLENQIQEVGLIETGGTAGNITLDWAQITSNATGSVVAATSFMRATKVS